MKKFAFLLVFYVVYSTNLYAVGVAAGTQIENSVELTYDIGGISHNTSSNIVIDRVDQVLDVDIVSNDASGIYVSKGQTNAVLTFRITNTGNGTDTFALSADANASNDFTVTNPKIYEDTNNNGLFDVAIDTQISEIVLDADEFATLFFVSDIPTGSYTTGDISANGITAVSKIGGSGIPGTSYAGAGAGGTFAVDGASGGRDSVMGRYVLVEIAPKLTKSAATSLTDVFTGTVITYTINVELIGTGTIENLIINDVMPSGTTYVAGSLKLDGNSLSDGVDSDIGSFGGGVVSVNFGNITQSISGDFNKNISFEVTVN